VAYKPGESGNLKGRPPKIATAQALRDVLMPDMPEIIGILKEQAKNGDLSAIKLLLDRCYPAIKPQSLPVSIPVGKDIVSSGNNIIGETFGGQLAPETGALLLAGLASQAKIQEVNELNKRIEELERVYGDNSPKKR
jgi:hypothetical protein